MTLYYTLVFLLLMAEVLMFVLLILPLPFASRKKIFGYISSSPVIAKLQYGMKIAIIFILILFVDSLNRASRVRRELADLAFHSRHGTMMGTERTAVQARKFYSERNMYLCGFTLFLSFILNRVYAFTLDILTLEQKVKDLQSAIDRDEGSIAKKNREIDVIKERAAGLSREYMALSDLCEELEKSGKAGTPKK